MPASPTPGHHQSMSEDAARGVGLGPDYTPGRKHRHPAGSPNRRPQKEQECQMKKHHGFMLLAAASFGMAGAAAPVEDPDSLQIRSETVRYDADQVQDRKSAQKLFFRIRHAAEEVCRIASNPRGY